MNDNLKFDVQPELMPYLEQVAAKVSNFFFQYAEYHSPFEYCGFMRRCERQVKEQVQEQIRFAMKYRPINLYQK